MPDLFPEQASGAAVLIFDLLGVSAELAPPETDPFSVLCILRENQEIIAFPDQRSGHSEPQFIASFLRSEVRPFDGWILTIGGANYRLVGSPIESNSLTWQFKAVKL